MSESAALFLILETSMTSFPKVPFQDIYCVSKFVPLNMHDLTYI